MADPVLEVDHLSVQVGDTAILDDVSISVGSGRFVSIIGPNGAGKSTLIRCLDGLLDPDQGSIRINGRPIKRFSRRALARVVSYVPQSEVGASHFAVATFVEMGRYPHLGPWAALSGSDYEAVRRALAMTDTSHLAERSMSSLSGGEHQRVMIAAAIAQGGSVLLLDEPTTFLDYRHQVQVVDLLERLHREQSMTIVAATHDLNRTVAASDEVLALRNGSVVFHGPAERVFDTATLESIYGTSFELVAMATEPLPLVVPARNGR
jgi:iron complex transport system ATP-binding protein